MKLVLESLTLISISVVGCANGFVPSCGHHAMKVAMSATKQDDIYEQEEMMAWNARNAVDPGMEAAMGERAVMIADKDFKLNDKKKSKRKKKAVEDKESAHIISPMKVLYRAYKMAHDLVAKKRDKLKEKMDGAKVVEQQYMWMKRTTEELEKVLEAYTADPLGFKKDVAASGRDESSLAMEVLERIIAVSEEEMLQLEREEESVIGSFLEALQREEIAEARYAQAQYQEEEARKRIQQIEEFSDEYELEERRRDMALAHANLDEEKFQKREKSRAIRDENEKLIQDFDMNKKFEKLKDHEKELKADLKEIQEMMMGQLRKEWEEEREKKMRP